MAIGSRTWPMGRSTGVRGLAQCCGFERFFQQMGTPADTIDPDSRPFMPDFPRMQAAAEAHRMEFRPDFTWPDA